MYELQLFDHETGHYVPVETGEDPAKLMDSVTDDRRVIDKERAKPLPLKPRIPYGMSGKPRKYKPDTMIEPAPVEVLIKRAVAWYEQRAANGERNIPVYAWKGEAKYNHEMRAFAKGGPLGAFRFVELDPQDFEPVETSERCAA